MLKKISIYKLFFKYNLYYFQIILLYLFNKRYNFLFVNLIDFHFKLHKKPKEKIEILINKISISNEVDILCFFKKKFHIFITQIPNLKLTLFYIENIFMIIYILKIIKT